MKLIDAQVTDYKCIDDSNLVSVDQVTCLVGKNESGKTTFLEALAKLNPIEGKGTFIDLDYLFTSVRPCHRGGAKVD